MEKAKLWDLFIIFARIGGFTFGGGYAMLPMLKRELVENRKWVSEKELLDYYAVGQCTPGIIAVNTATFVGYKMRNVIGAIAATAGMIAPSLVIIMSIALVLQGFSENQYVIHALNGIKIAVGALILNAVVGLFKKSVGTSKKTFKGIFAFLIFSAVFILGLFFTISPIIIVVGTVILGLIYGKVMRSFKKEEI